MIVVPTLKSVSQCVVVIFEEYALADHASASRPNARGMGEKPRPRRLRIYGTLRTAAAPAAECVSVRSVSGCSPYSPVVGLPLGGPPKAIGCLLAVARVSRDTETANPLPRGCSPYSIEGQSGMHDIRLQLRNGGHRTNTKPKSGLIRLNPAKSSLIRA